MAIKDRKERDKLDRRKLIIESATKLFLKDGYEKTSIRNIADDIEYSPATIYLYFKEKDEIFFIIHEQGFLLLNKIFTRHAAIEDPMERLSILGHAYIQFGLENPDYYDLMFIMRAPLNEISCLEKWDAGENAFQFLLTTVEECLNKKLIKEQEHYLVALSIWSFVHGLVSLYIRERLKSMILVPEKELKEQLSKSWDYYTSTLKK
jgi:AcrR family transcriptional regulator